MWSTCHVSFPDHLWTVKCRISLKKAMGHGSLGKCQSKRRVQLSSWNYISDAGSGNSVEPKQASFCFLFWVIFGNIKSFVGMTECSSSLTIALYQWDFPFHGKFLFLKTWILWQTFLVRLGKRENGTFLWEEENFFPSYSFFTVCSTCPPLLKKKVCDNGLLFWGDSFLPFKRQKKNDHCFVLSNLSKWHNI